MPTIGASRNDVGGQRIYIFLQPGTHPSSRCLSAPFDVFFSKTLQATMPTSIKVLVWGRAGLARDIVLRLLAREPDFEVAASGATTA